MVQFVLGVGIGAGAMLAVAVWMTINRSWRHAFFARVPIPWQAILGMRLRGTPPTLIVDACVALVKRGKQLDWSVVEAAYLAHRGPHLDSLKLAALVEETLPDPTGVSRGRKETDS